MSWDTWNIAVLPSPVLISVWHIVAWGVVLAWGLSALVSALVPASLIARWPVLRRAAVGLVVLWCAASGVYSPDHWLGLAFQAPSISTVLLCVVLLWRSQGAAAGLGTLAVAGMLLGWLLLLDTFALLPVELYAWGFSPVAVALVALLTLLPWVINPRSLRDATAWVAPLALVLFVVTRLPSGNVWDALLDPWLWVALQVGVVRWWRGR